ncbi:hypothetical protein SAMN05421761_103110 [Belliella pelovolcani]|uniref:Uncharacterized protein n=1 Tax=Belliella pelovolcani TaxID=529505 RepID=A0A1N7L7S1_9BACT|nr:hypothetical protein SAMN05421761_103110 [Belliella pelovolcani]
MSAYGLNTNRTYLVGFCLFIYNNQYFTFDPIFPKLSLEKYARLHFLPDDMLL